VPEIGRGDCGVDSTKVEVGAGGADKRVGPATEVGGGAVAGGVGVEELPQAVRMRVSARRRMRGVSVPSNGIRRQKKALQRKNAKMRNNAE
jgi:hypothetical protein